MVLGALAACVVALAAYVLTTNTVKDRQAQLEAVTAQADATTQRVAQLKPYADFQAMAETRIQTVKDLASSRFDWEQALRDISRAIPADVTLQALNGTISSAVRWTAAASAARSPRRRSSSRAAPPARSSVATLLSRLRNVDGVTRVSLGKSLRPEKTENAGPSPIAGGAEAAAARASARRSFEIVLFFEGAEVPATVEDITVQPAAGAEPATAGDGAATDAPAAAGRGRHDAARRPGSSGGTATPASSPEGGGSPMTRTNKILLSVVALGAAIAAFYFFVLAPKREEVAKLDTEIAAKEAEIEQARLTLAGYEQAKESYKRNYATLARLGKAVPADDDVRSLLVQLESTADRSGVTSRRSSSAAASAAHSRAHRRRPTPAPARSPRRRARCRSPAACCPRCRSASASPAATSTCRASSPGSSTS